MSLPARMRSPVPWLAAGAGLAAAAYAAHAAIAWMRYGRSTRGKAGAGADPFLDRFMPEYEVVERNSIRVAAPAELTYDAAYHMDLSSSAIVRIIFRVRELVLGAEPPEEPGPPGLVPLAKALGWGVLAEIPGREIVMGAVTQPWAADIVFRALRPEEFAAFREPGYVKIVWTLRADPDGDVRSIHRTETRSIAMDGAARRKFRLYWAAFSAGIVLIRRIGSVLVKQRAEALYAGKTEGRTECQVG